jgi:hypothetical protein
MVTHLVKKAKYKHNKKSKETHYCNVGVVDEISTAMKLLPRAKLLWLPIEGGERGVQCCNLL